MKIKPIYFIGAAILIILLKKGEIDAGTVLSDSATSLILGAV